LLALNTAIAFVKPIASIIVVGLKSDFKAISIIAAKVVVVKSAGLAKVAASTC
jgi:hypothetical protein